MSSLVELEMIELQQRVTISIMFLDVDLEGYDLWTEVQYLIADLRDLEGMGGIKFEERNDIRGTNEVRTGIKFDVDLTMLGAILRRLHDRLYYGGSKNIALNSNPLETLFLIQIENIKLEIQTHKPEDIVGLWSVCQNRTILPAQSEYLVMAETYTRTKGGLSSTEEDNLQLKQKVLKFYISEEEAELLKIKAAGLYRTKEARQSYFEEITQAEFRRIRAYHGLSIAPKDTWPVLQDLAENLGIPTLKAKAIYQNHWQRYQDDIKLKDEQQALKSAEDARIAAEAYRQQQAHQAQEQRDLYKALCHQALAKGLYPSEFDQGRLDQARRLRGIAPVDAVSIEAAVRDELYGSVDSAAGVDYTRLRDLLMQQAWQAADLETETNLLKALNQDMQPVTAATVQWLPAVDLATIDALWQRHSGGRFGFKAQQQVYRSQQQILQDDPQRWLGFQQGLGWRDQPSWLSRGFRPYYDLDFSRAAPPGHLPTWRWCCPSLSHRYSPSLEVVEAVLAHLNTCMPLEAVSIPTFDQTLVVGGVASAS